jgi:hypothetical protein
LPSQGDENEDVSGNLVFRVLRLGLRLPRALAEDTDNIDSGLI